MRKIFIFIILVLLAGVTGCRQEETLDDEINDVIASFIENYADDYVNEEKMDYYVVSALAALEEVTLDDYVSNADVNAYLDNLEYNSINDAFIAAVISNAFNIPLNQKVIDFLTEVDEVSPYEYVYGLIALKIAGVNLELKEELLSNINIIREEDYRDPDYAAIGLLATSNEDIDHAPLFNLIDPNLSKDGIISWGEANSATTANVIIGLIAMGYNPAGDSYITEDVNLLEALLTYEEEGGFVLHHGDDLDLQFSTPQAFAALVTYKVFVETGEAFNLFI